MAGGLRAKVLVDFRNTLRRYLRVISRSNTASKATTAVIATIATLVVLLCFSAFVLRFSHPRRQNFDYSRRFQCNLNESYRTQLFIAIITQAQNRDARDAIRSSWLSQPETPPTPHDHHHHHQIHTTHCFFIASPHDDALVASVQHESQQSSDIVTFPTIRDHYNNLTLLTLAVFDWIHRSQLSTEYVLKADDDVYIRQDRLQVRLDEISATQHQQQQHVARGDDVYAGREIRYASPYRNASRGRKARKWAISREEYKFRAWPPYCFGFGYVLSSTLVQHIAACLPRDFSCCSGYHAASVDADDAELHKDERHKSTPAYVSCIATNPKQCAFQPVRFEDVTVGGIVSSALARRQGKSLKLDCVSDACKRDVGEVLHGAVFHEERFVNEPWEYSRKRKSNACREDFIIMHRMSPRMIREYHRERRKHNDDASICATHSAKP